MTTPQAILYGIVQGVTEFIPVSSTAHLRLVPAFLHWSDPGSAFTAVIQLGTVLAVFVYFWKDLSEAFMGWAKSFKGDKNSIEARTGWAVFWATIPISLLGLALHKHIEGPFRSLWVIGSSLIIMGIVMFIADKKDISNRGLDSLQPSDGIKIGLWQCLALIPGMSRSGSTISGALFGGFDRKSAARLSFLMSVPAVTLAGLWEGASDLKKLSSDMLTPTIVATGISFVVGYACISWLINFISTKGVRPFVAYRIALGVLILILCSTGVIRASESPDNSNVPPKAASTAV